MDEEEINTNPLGAGRKKNLPRDFLRMDWDPKPGQDNITRITRLMKTSDTKQEKYLRKTTINEISSPNLSSVLVWNNGKWVETGKRCLDCGKIMSKQLIIDKHSSICDKGLLINKEEEQEILDLVRSSKHASTKSNSAG